LRNEDIIDLKDLLNIFLWCKNMKLDIPQFKLLKVLILTAKHKPDIEKLQLINQFFNNRIRYSTDKEVWGVNEYWASLYEFLEKSAGDCDDFSIAKYFALKYTGIEENNLKILYSKLLTTGESHMVLVYCGSEILVLDNKIDNILTLSDRSDLLPILGFNSFGLWTFKQNKFKLVTQNSNRLVRWRELQERMKNIERNM